MSKKIINYVLLSLLLIISYVILLTLMSSFMTKSIRNNIRDSSVLLYEEGNWPERHIFYRGYGIPFDNYMDALMLSTVWSTDTKRPLRSMMLMPHDGHKARPEISGDLESSDAVGDLVRTIAGDDYGREYARYWHGYILWLKPLLLFMNIRHIRIFLTVLLAFLFILLTGSLIKGGHITEAIIIGTGLICGDYFYMGTSLQGVSIFLISMVMSIILWYAKDKWSGYLFLITGSLAAFMDLLTVPLIALVIPLVVYQIKENGNIKSFVRNSLIWILGFSFTWSVKWFLVDLIFERNIVRTAFTQMMWRTSGNGEITFRTAFTVCALYMRTFLIPAILVFIVCLIIGRKNITKKRLLENISYLIVMTTPVIWYMILKEHSCYHAYFTYRNLIAFHIGIFLFLYGITKKTIYER